MQLSGIRVYLIAFILSAVLISACRRKADVTNANALTLTNSQNIKITYKNKEDAQYMALVFALHKIRNSSAPDRMEKFVDGAWALSKDYPNRPNGYQCLMAAIEDYASLGKPDQARALAKEMIDSSAPDNFKQWAKGFLYRLASMGKPVAMQFAAVDGRDVDLAKMKGKVVLVVFSFTGFRTEMLKVKASFEKYQSQGFEVIGISCDTDKSELEKFVEENGITWPQYFDGKQQGDNKFAVEFGIDGIPHMFLVDKKGCLRFDDVRARTKDNQVDFEKKIEELLAER